MAKSSLKDFYTNSILNKKKQYQDFMDKGDTVGAENVAKSAQGDYDWLKSNGYAGVADTLSKQNYAQAAQSAKSGKVGVRNYLEKLGATYGMDSGKVGSLLNYNNDTGEVSVGGVNLGVPTEIGGTTYAKSDDLDSAWSKAMKKLGYSQNPDIQYGKATSDTLDYISENRDLTKKFHDEYLQRSDALDDATLNKNPWDTEWGKAIMGQYNFNGNNAAKNELAGRAASNGGNIDSYAAANAQRQQLAYTNAGNAAVLENWMQRLGVLGENLDRLKGEQDNKLSHLENSVTQNMQAAQMIFDNNETKKNNQVDNLVKQADVTGYIPREWNYANNQYFNSDGTLAKPDTDYMAIINTATEKLKNTNLSDSERSAWEKTLRDASAARNYKINQLGYSDNGQITPNYSQEQTAAMRDNAASRESAERISLGEQDAAVNAANTEAAIKQYEIDQNNATEIQKALIEAETEVKKKEEKAKKSITEEQMTQIENWAIEYGIKAPGQPGVSPATDIQKYKFISAVSDLDISDDAMSVILSEFGITEEEIENAMLTPLK